MPIIPHKGWTTPANKSSESRQEPLEIKIPESGPHFAPLDEGATTQTPESECVTVDGDSDARCTPLEPSETDITDPIIATGGAIGEGMPASYEPNKSESLIADSVTPLKPLKISGDITSVIDAYKMPFTVGTICNDIVIADLTKQDTGKIPVSVLQHALSYTKRVLQSPPDIPASSVRSTLLPDVYDIAVKFDLSYVCGCILSELIDYLNTGHLIHIESVRDMLQDRINISSTPVQY